MFLYLPLELRRCRQLNSEGKIILNGIELTENNNASINLDEKSKIIEGVNTIKIFAASDDVLKPYEYSKSFIVISENKNIPDSDIIEIVNESQTDYWYALLIIPVLIGVLIIIIKKSSLSTNNK